MYCIIITSMLSTVFLTIGNDCSCFLNVHREAVPVMQKEGKGSIVFVSSGAGVASYIGYSAYAPTKWALRGLADTLRNELLADNIKVGGVF